MTLYIFNSLITPIDFDSYPLVFVVYEKISIEKARKLLKKEQFVSAIGHEATAKLLSQLLGINIPVNRITVFMKPKDMGIHFFLKQRLPEGAVLNEQQLKQLQYWLVLSKVYEDENCITCGTSIMASLGYYGIREE